MSVVDHSSAAEEPVWLELAKLHTVSVPQDIAVWLDDQGSLTKALVEACDGQFRVAVQFQDWGDASEGERQLLAMPAGQKAMLREVDLLCNEQPWVFARTVIPEASLSGRAAELVQLGSKPLGAVLFSDPDTRRRTVEIARLSPSHGLYAAACAHLEDKPSEVWGRRTLFEYAGKPILVNEIFLPR